jgi:hypothetical protein
MLLCIPVELANLTEMLSPHDFRNEKIEVFVERRRRKMTMSSSSVVPPQKQDDNMVGDPEDEEAGGGRKGKGKNKRNKKNKGKKKNEEVEAEEVEERIFGDGLYPKFENEILTLNKRIYSYNAFVYYYVIHSNMGFNCFIGITMKTGK